MKKYRLNRDARIEAKMLDSAAFRELSATGIRVLLRFLQKRTWSNYKVGGKKKIMFNDTGLSFTYEEASELGIKNTAFYDAVKRLVELGFIDIEHQGGAYGKDYSRYALSKRWQDYGTENFHHIKKQRSLQRGLDVRSNMKRGLITPTEIRNEQLRKSVVMEE